MADDATIVLSWRDGRGRQTTRRNVAAAIRASRSAAIRKNVRAGAPSSDLAYSDKPSSSPIAYSGASCCNALKETFALSISSAPTRQSTWPTRQSTWHFCACNSVQKRLFALSSRSRDMCLIRPTEQLLRSRQLGGELASSPDQQWQQSCLGAN